ncbi:MAG: UDP-N-acetylmuramate dehydrogenase, partial [Candidatus Margulisiibacteriota bacterium]
AQKDRGGLEFLTGIPGTVGGAVVSNAGAHGDEIQRYITYVDVLDSINGTSKRLSQSDCGFAYRHSIFRDCQTLIITRIGLDLDQQGFDQAKKQQILDWRKNNQPLSQPNAGSIFKNPPGDNAGRLIEEFVGKGFQVGQAAVSLIHANIFVNLGGATAADFQKLIAQVKKMVYDKSQIQLEEEIVQIC